MNGDQDQPIVVYYTHAADNHYYPKHPERPDRIHSITKALESLQTNENLVQLVNLNTVKLDQSLLHSVHDQDYLASIEKASKNTDCSIAFRDADDPDGPTFITPTTYQDALIAATSAINLVNHTITTPNTIGFSLCRPPGHHATSNESMGFCFINNIAVAARYAQTHHNISNILILDFDVHHGNGTQDIFYSDNSVLYIDMHQADVWPGSGGIYQIGVDDGVGYTVNIPLPINSGHDSAIKVFRQLVIPAARRFKPELILISAGYDAHKDDPLEQLEFQNKTYYELAREIRALARELCQGRCVFCLEGGYNVEALAASVVFTVRGLLGLELLDDDNAASVVDREEPEEEVDAMIERVGQIHNLL